MCDTGREDDGAPTLGQAMPMGDDVADQLPVVHPLGELLLDIVAALDQTPDRSGREGA